MSVKNYTSRDRVEALMLTTIEADWQDNFNIFLESAENYIDTFTGRNFVADTEYSAKVFDGSGSKQLILPDLVEIENITITVSDDSEEVLTTSQFYSYPANKTPKNRIVIDTDLVTYYFYKGQQNISVSAKWGYSVAVPKEIELAASIIMAGIINYAYEHNSEVVSEGIDDYNVTYNRKEDWVKYERAIEILKKYKKISF